MKTLLRTCHNRALRKPFHGPLLLKFMSKLKHTEQIGYKVKDVGLWSSRETLTSLSTEPCVLLGTWVWTMCPDIDQHRMSVDNVSLIYPTATQWGDPGHWWKEHIQSEPLIHLPSIHLGGEKHHMNSFATCAQMPAIHLHTVLNRTLIGHLKKWLNHFQFWRILQCVHPSWRLNSEYWQTPLQDWQIYPRFSSAVNNKSVKSESPSKNTPVPLCFWRNTREQSFVIISLIFNFICMTISFLQLLTIADSPHYIEQAELCAWIMCR